MAEPGINLEGKAKLRSHYRGIRAGCTESEIKHWDKLLHQNWLVHVGDEKFITFAGLYAAMNREANPFLSYPASIKPCFPIVQGKNIGFHHVSNPNDPEFFRIGSYGIYEPREDVCPKVPKSEMKTLYLPLLAFDEKGTRLGHGGGFYDRFCEGFPGRKIGIAFDWQFSFALIPRESHDVVLDELITPTRHLVFQKK